MREIQNSFWSLSFLSEFHPNLKEFRRVQFLKAAQQTAMEFAKENSAALLTAGGVVGTVATAVLAGRGGYKYAEIILKQKAELQAEELSETDPEENPYLRLDAIEIPTNEKIKLAVIYFGPPAAIGVATIASIIMSHRVSAAKAAALAAAYGLAERNLSEYKEKVAEKLTGPKKIAIDDELAQDRINKSAGSQNLVIIEGDVLCYDEATNRYFRGTMESIKRAQNATNAEIHNHDYADATFFYNELGLEKTVWSEEVGWNRDHLLELKITTAEAPDGRPCLAIDFAAFPRQDFIRPNHG
jgi:hypothetical protein